MTHMDLKDEFIQIIKRYSELSLMDTENETKNYIQEALTHLCLKYL